MSRNGSGWVEDKCVDLVVLWYCRRSLRSARYGGRPGWSALCGEFESDAPLYWKPVELFKECIWGDMIALLRYNSRECILHTLEASYMLLRTAGQNGVSIVKARRDQSQGNGNGGRVIHSWADLPKWTNVIKAWFGYCFSVRPHGEARVERGT